MPELRRNRARLARNQQQEKQTDTPVAGNHAKTRAAVAREAKKRPRTRLEAKRLKEKEEEGDQRNSNKSKRVEEEEEGKKVILISESGKKGKNLVVDIEEEEKVDRVKGVMADGSGGLSANKAGAQEEEGSTAPFPEKVCLFFYLIFFVPDLMFCYLVLL